MLNSCVCVATGPTGMTIVYSEQIALAEERKAEQVMVRAALLV